MRRRSILLLSALSARKGLAYAFLVVLNGVHAMIHGTPLDGGSLDAGIATLDAWAVSAIMMEG